MPASRSISGESSGSRPSQTPKNPVGMKPFKSDYLLKFAVADPDSKDCWVLWNADKVDVLPVARPVVISDGIPANKSDHLPV